jgi:GxxExxY protein
MTEIPQIQREDIRDPRTYAVIGAAMEVHSELGCGFLEPVYQEAVAIEFAQRGVPFKAEVDVPVAYKGRTLNACYRADFICYDSVVVELKALRRLTGTEESQLLNYLKATGLQVRLLLNFGSRSLEHRRLVLTQPKSA